MSFTEKTKPNQGVIEELMKPELRTVETYDSSAADIEPMTFVGKRTLGAVTATKTDVVGVNKGAITLTGSPVDAGAALGEYDIVCIEPYNASGPVPAVFQITGPNDFIDTFTAGVAYDGPVNFTKASNTGDAAGDKGKIVVAQAAGDGKCVPINYSAVDGTQHFYGVCVNGVAKSATAKKGITIVEFTVLSEQSNAYPAGATDNQKATTRAEARAKHVVIKTSMNVA